MNASQVIVSPVSLRESVRESAKPGGKQGTRWFVRALFSVANCLFPEWLKIFVFRDNKASVLLDFALSYRFIGDAFALINKRTGRRSR
jgi:hypothetical protein